MSFIAIETRSYKIVHGFDQQNQEIVEEVTQHQWIKKAVAVSRIQSITEKFIRMHYSHDRIIYWEYRGGMAALLKRMKKASIAVA